MEIIISNSSGLPIYEQIKEQIKYTTIILPPLYYYLYYQVPILLLAQ